MPGDNPFRDLRQEIDKQEREKKIDTFIDTLLPTLERIELHLYNISEHLLAMRRL